MNTAFALGQQQSVQAVASRRGWLRWLVIGACVPIALFLIGAVVVGVREFSATGKLQAKVDRLRQAAEPYDNASYAQWYRNHTHSEGTQAWLHILESVSATAQLGSEDDLPIVGNGLEFKELDPQVEWQNALTTKEYLHEMQGLIQQAHQLKKWPAPVRFPIEFHGEQTLLPHYQQSRSVTRLLQLDFEYAFYSKEFERAMQDLRSIGTVAGAIDSDLCLIVDLVVSATLGAQYREIQRSLLTANWPPEKLNELREIIGPVRFTTAKWKKLFTNERAMFGDDVAAGDLARITGTKEASLAPLFKTGRLRIFEAYDELINVGNADLAALKSTSKLTLDRVIFRDATFDVDASTLWIGLMFPAAEQMARAMENEESHRRLTLTAVALRQFKHQAGRWPSRLRELAEVGLTPVDYSTVNRGEFGYETTDGVAYVWGSDWVGDAPVGRTRPNEEPDSIPNGTTLVTLR